MAGVVPEDAVDVKDDVVVVIVVTDDVVVVIVIIDDVVVDNEVEGVIFEDVLGVGRLVVERVERRGML